MGTENSFLGTGWGFPPEFGEGGADVRMVSGEDDIRESLNILLSTSLKERNMHPNFGCDLHGFLFEEVDQSLINSIRGLVSDVILFYEPRIEADEIEVFESEAEPGMLIISIDYNVRSTNTRYNLVYPFYITEATNPDVDI